MGSRLLAIYLNDHLAGSTGALELARRARSANRGTPFEAAFERLAAEIEEDRDVLLDVMRRLGVARDPVKEVAGWLAEKAGRLKLNGRLTGYSPLSRVLELELLALGVEGKRTLWRALREVAAGDARLDGVDLAALLRRAERQRRLVEQQRLRAAAIAFAPGA
ncbi:MAG TPA: hypothetical protein VHF51_16355 [Solirubrobacteraceae bacterium]|nr:hypothetical protein [Solirubrobacteraceae bacterium]